MLIKQCGIVAITVCAFAAFATGAGVLGRSLAIEGEAGGVSPMPDAAVMGAAQAEETRKPRPAPVAEVPKAAGDDRREPIPATERRLSPWGEPVDRAIRKGVRLLIQQQLPNGSWFDLMKEVKSGSTSLAAGPAGGGRGARLADYQQGAGIPPGFPA